MTGLTEETLTRLNAGVSIPRYDRRDVTTGIVHIGVGNFHRSHQAMYIDTLMNSGAALDWGICGIGLQPSNVAMRDALAAQDGLYTLVIRHGDGTWDARVIGSIVEYMFAPDDPEAAIEKMAAPTTRIVSLTVTEGGYNLDAVTGEFNPSDESAAADLRPGAVPRTVFGLVTEALARRRARGLPAFTIVSCDNIQGNGHVSRRAFTAFACLRDPELADWMTREVRFPNCMVDRITPKTTDEDRAELSRRFGLEDRWPVLCEPFTQWVLEDDFADGRPPLEDAGVQIVPDVEPYELMKLRLLNASHQALCYPGHLVGYRFVHEVTTDPLFARFLLDYMTAEAIPTLRPVPGVDLPGYARQLIERFSNPEVRDTVARLCSNGSDCIPKFLLPVVRHQLAAGGPVTRSAAVVASWARYAEGTDENGHPHELDDDLAAPLQAAARRQRRDPAAFLDGNRAVFGDLADDPRFTRVYGSILTSLLERGVRRTFADLDQCAALAQPGPAPSADGEEVALTTMRRVVVYPGRIAVETADVPAPGPDEALVRTLVAGVCGSDLHAAHGRHPFVALPYRPGHEVVGVIETTGSAAGDYAPGQRVIVTPYLPCWTCKMCTSGRENLCENLQFFGCGYPQGGMADHFTLPASRLFPVPDTLDDQTAALIEPLATPVHAVRLAGDVAGRTVAVLGAGTIGLFTLAVLRAHGAAKIISTDPNPGKRERAAALGADATIDARTPDVAGQVRAALGGSADIVFDCVGVQSSMDQAIAIADKGGTVVVVGVPAREVTVPLPIVQDHQIRIQGSATYLPEDYQESTDLLRRGAVKTADFVTATRPLAQVAEAFELASSGNHVKILVTVGE